MYTHSSRRAGFSLIELMVAISIITFLSTIIFAALSSGRKSARDAQRLSSMRQMQTALELYYSDNNQTYPAGDGAGTGGWDTPGNGSFITSLVPTYLAVNLRDPLTNDAAGNLRYAKFAAGSNGCPAARGGYYVLGIADLETSNGTSTLSPGFSCSGRNFQYEMEYVLGRFEK